MDVTQLIDLSRRSRGNNEPFFPFDIHRDILRRALLLLRSRASEQVVEAASTLDWIIDEYFAGCKEAYIANLNENGGWELGHLPEGARNVANIRWLVESWNEHIEDPPPFATPDTSTGFQAISESIGQYKLDDLAFPAGKEYEYFAVHSLSTLALAFTRSSEDSSYFQADRATLVANLTLESLESLCWAERLQQVEALQRRLNSLEGELQLQRNSDDRVQADKIKAHVSLQAHKAAIARHRENRQMKEQVRDWYMKQHGDYPSMDKAAEAATSIVPVTFRTARQ